VNNGQRVVLITGAVFFLYFLFTSPQVSIVKGTYVIPSPDKKDVARIVDINTAITRAVGVLGATALFFIALKSRKGKGGASPGNAKPGPFGRGEGNERQPARKNLFGKLLGFLKDFF